MSDVRDLVGDELEPGEHERLQRVHELLGEVGPPPELSPALTTSPEPPRARVIPFSRRYRFAAAAAAALAAVVLFSVGYLVGAAGESGPVRTLAMRGPDGATASLAVFEDDDAGNWPMELRVQGLPPGDYELWLTKDDKLAEPCGAFLVGRGTTTVPLNAPYRLRQFDAWVVVEAGKDDPVLTT